MAQQEGFAPQLGCVPRPAQVAEGGIGDGGDGDWGEGAQAHQPRFGHGRSRLRRRGRVALARKLLMALWRLVETGLLPDGAALKAAVHL
jgi:hypothetical protein